MSFLSSTEHNVIHPLYSPDQLASKYNTDSETDVEYKPLLILTIKYADTAYTTGEGTLLWDLTDGEIILNTNTWEKSHGLGDCIRMGATKQDCKVVLAMARKGGQLPRESLRRALRIDADLLDQWIEQCRQKKLLVPSGNGYRLHMQNPKMPKRPITIMDETIATFTTKKVSLPQVNFDEEAISDFATAYFGSDFAIQKAEVALLPIYVFTSESSSGRLQTNRVNAVTGNTLSD